MRYPFLSPLLLISLLVVPHSARADSCPEMNKRIEAQEKQLSDLIALKKEFDEKFDRNVAGDFAAQTEGMLDDLQHSAALKAAFARKRLTKSIDSKRLSLVAIKTEFCRQCANPRKNGLSVLTYCDKCPGAPSCH